MLGYSKEEKDEIIRQFLGPGGSEDPPRCAHCGEVFQFEFIHPSAGQEGRISVNCPECANGFTWRQLNLPGNWTNLQLRYFLECLEAERPLLCPADDCFVLIAEFEGQTVEFRCPFCNRRGKSKWSGERLSRASSAGLVKSGPDAI